MVLYRNALGINYSYLDSLLTKYCSGDQYWKLTDDSIAPGYPRPVNRDWRGLPGTDNIRSQI